ncbi:PSMD10 [Lepeophtheirus salmonis]|uniref:PSMD10 n=1 Tax=Lepeophtheirus salmonis TaxID=72036 RepID=A0A7R8GYS2_LEPSM|nr:PSMD10 [Lepeophtheirus salmonis]CAF2751582.1 PSMD10 [Lepeophtheirus salmonis]
MSDGAKVKTWIKCIQDGEFHRFQEEMSRDLNRNLSIQDESGRKILHWASSLGSFELVEWLLQKGADVDPVDEALWTPLIIASSAGNEKIVRILLSFGALVDAKTDQGRTALFYACSRNRISIVKLLENVNADVNVQDKLGATSLHRATGVGNVELMNYLLNHFSNKINANLQDNIGNTPLHIACEEINFQCVEVLLKIGCDPSITNKEGKKAIELAPIDMQRKLQSYIDRFVIPK